MLELFGLPALTLDKDKGWTATPVGLVGLIFPGPEIVDAASPEAYPVMRFKLARSIWTVNDNVYLIDERLRCSWMTDDIQTAFLVTYITNFSIFDVWRVGKKLGWYRLIVSRGFLRDIRKRSHELLKSV